ncbi:ABC transporter permease [Natrarchaeobius oligotrophus]|uniref:ABC transporter permease n=1 Tax=Natrarchaeobius chitinivorans TaxID=1679083 RepID=A0A3N6MLJ6_NATCH|nr:ABC transporter permease [Natrarchaeobius chitinivorans]RQH02335.1 ABC transporter permease [Natrarchaeobius chitinivorans]
MATADESPLRQRLTLSMDDRNHQLILQAGFGVFLLALYSAFAYLGYPSERIPSILMIVEALQVQIAEEGLLGAVWDALYAIFIGFFLATLVGIPMGILMGVSRTIEELLDPYVNAIYVVPYAAIVPALIVWFGTGIRIRVAICFLFAFFPIVINSFEGARTTPEGLLEVAESFNASWLFTMKNVVLPYEIPYILAGLRMGIGRAVRGLVLVEIIVAVTGLGGLIQNWSAAFRLEGVISVVLVLMFLGVTLPWLMGKVYDRLIWWDVERAGF